MLDTGTYGLSMHAHAVYSFQRSKGLERSNLTIKSFDDLLKLGTAERCAPIGHVGINPHGLHAFQLHDKVLDFILGVAIKGASSAGVSTRVAATGVFRASAFVPSTGVTGVLRSTSRPGTCEDAILLVQEPFLHCRTVAISS